MHKVIDDKVHLPQSYLADLAYTDAVEDWRVVERKIVDHKRWSVVKEMVVKTPDGNYYRTRYSVGATEMQEEYPYDIGYNFYPRIDNSYWVPVDRVEPMQMMVTVYVDYVE